MRYGFNNVYLPEKENERFYTLVDEHTELIKRFNDLNNKITQTHVPSNISRKEKRNYDFYANMVRSLQAEMLEYENETLQFICKPSMTLGYRGEHTDEELNFLRSHSIHIVSILRNEVFNSRNILINNYENLVQEAETVSNFKFAKRFYWLAISGLVLALIGLFASLLGG